MRMVGRVGGVLVAAWAAATILALPAGAYGGAGTGLLGSPLVVGGSPLASEQLQQAQRARIANPERIDDRYLSATAYERLHAGAAKALAGEAFASTIDHPAGGLPSLPRDARITGFPSDFAASLSLSDHHLAVIESTAPIAAQTGAGRRAGIDLALRKGSGAFWPDSPAVAVRIPTHLSEGAEIPSIGVSLTPVDAHGAPLQSAGGALDGASVFYSDSEQPNAGVRDLDTLIKPTTLGFSEETLLRSQRSPQRLFFKLGLPQGAHLIRDRDGAFEIVGSDGRIASVQKPFAHDAEGTPVPVSMTLSGDLLSISVAHRVGQYRMPILVDPTTWDELLTSGAKKTNWHYVTSERATEFSANENAPTAGDWRITIGGRHAATESGALWYTTQGISTIYSFSIEGFGKDAGANVETLLEIDKPNGAEAEREASELMPEEWSGSWGLSGHGAANNRAVYQQQSLKATGAGETVLTHASVTIEQPTGAEISFDKTDPTVDGGRTNVLYGNGAWLGPNSGGAFEIRAKDPGIGVSWVGISSGSWVETFPIREKGECTGDIQCPPAVNKGYPYSSSWPDGEDSFEANACDSAEQPAQCAYTPAQKVRVDGTPPHNITLTGLPASDEIGGGEYHLRAEATDGSGTTPSSGVKSIALFIDGREVGSPGGSCPAGPCTGTIERTIAGHNYAAGKHYLTVVATDRAGNVASEKYVITVRAASPVPLGPGSLNPQSGEYTLTATDASFGGGLTVARSYNSRHTSAGAQGSLGPQWALAMAGQESITKQPNGSMVLTDASGAQTTFATDEKGGLTSPPGDPNLTLAFTTSACEPGKSEYLLRDAAAGTSTCFAVPPGGNGEVLTPSLVRGPATKDTSTYVYETVEISGKKIERPKEVLAPVPVGVTCSLSVKPVELKTGCRALSFNYATATTATGEGEKEWGDINGQLTRVYYTAYDPSTKAMHEVAVAHYLYDSQGRLRTEWDPRIEPEAEMCAKEPLAKGCLARIYGYDAEGHVSALTSPGQESWAFTYGTDAGDAGTGRIVKVLQAPASVPLWGGEQLKVTVAPSITGTPKIGVRLTVSNGYWTGNPATYGYQWQRCNLTGGECSPIPGATNANYTPSGADVSHMLEAVVSATNGGGSATAIARVVLSAGPSQEMSLPSGSKPFDITSGPEGNLWFTEHGTSKIGEITTAGTVSEYALPAGSEPEGITAGSAEDVWFTDYGTSKIGKITTAGAVTEYALRNGSDPSGIASGPDGELWFAEEGNSKIGKITTTGAVTEYALPGDSFPNGITSGPDGNLWFTDPVMGKIGKITTAGAVTEYSVPAQSFPYTIVSGSDGNLWFTEEGTSEIGKITTAGAMSEYALSTGSEPKGITPGPEGNMWFTFTNHGTSKVADITPALNEGGAATPNAGSTVEYNVPVSGEGAPHAMGTKEVEEGWGQKDLPVEATAIFPPDEPQGWPASDYKRASVLYFDAQGRTVNVATPSGGISTTEYNSTNDPVRSLSADNRAKALKEGAKSAEVAKTLDSESTYNEEGTELLSTLGPKHLVELANGKEVQARTHTVFSYDEGAPSEGGPYRLVTKTTQGAQIEGESEQDVRTTTTSYSGQSNLGWKLREPTSVTTDPSGLKLTHTTLYEEATAQVIETRMPMSTGAESPHNMKTVYYGAAANAQYPACGEHPQWANMVCESLPAKQPETAGLPALPITTFTAYNMWGALEADTVTSGTNTRTTKIAYDSADRPLSKEITSNKGTALPKVSYTYNPSTGGLVKESTGTGEATESLTSAFNTWGQLTSYEDASGNVAGYEYENGGDGRLLKASDAKGAQTYGYNQTTGELTELVDTAAGAFTAEYDAEGNLLKENYPNGLTATYTYNAVDQPTNLAYDKTTNCSTNCEWFKDNIVTSIHGQSLYQSSTLGTNAYVYDAAGRLTQVQQRPTEKSCTKRVYAYDADSNRTSTTTLPPGAEGKCATEGGEVESHSYDEADRLTDKNATYNPFGDMTKLSAADAGGHELSSSYFVDGQAASEEQNGQTLGYSLDPADRIREVTSTGKILASEVEHYDGPGSSPAWTGELSGSYKRDISGIGGGLAAIQHNGETPVLQLTNLHGDIVATVKDSSTVTGLESTIAEASPYGVPATEGPPKYSWLGAHEVPTSLPSGVQSMGVRAYVPQLGRFMQPDPIPGGSANAYSYVFGDPVNTFDLSGAYVEAGYGQSWENGGSQRAAEAQAAREQAAREEAERAAAFAAEQARLSEYGEEGGEEEWWDEEEWEEEEWEEEEAAYHGSSKQAGNSLVEGAGMGNLFEGQEGEANEAGRDLRSCETGGSGPCVKFVGRKARRKARPKKKREQCPAYKEPSKAKAEPGPAVPTPNAEGKCPEGWYAAPAFWGELKCYPEGQSDPNADKAEEEGGE